MDIDTKIKRLTEAYEMQKTWFVRTWRYKPHPSQIHEYDAAESDLDELQTRLDILLQAKADGLSYDDVKHLVGPAPRVDVDGDDDGGDEFYV